MEGPRKQARAEMRAAKTGGSPIGRQFFGRVASLPARNDFRPRLRLEARNAGPPRTRVSTRKGPTGQFASKRSNGSPDLSASRAAIDMSITWDGLLKIKQKNGTRKTIRTLPRSGLNHDLWAVGATYGMFKLVGCAALVEYRTVEENCYAV